MVHRGRGELSGRCWHCCRSTRKHTPQTSPLPHVVRPPGGGVRLHAVHGSVRIRLQGLTDTVFRTAIIARYQGNTTCDARGITLAAQEKGVSCSGTQVDLPPLLSTVIIAPKFYCGGVLITAKGSKRSTLLLCFWIALRPQATCSA